MPNINPMLLKLAQSKVWSQAGAEKRAFQPPAGGDPAAAGGMPPPGGAPPMDPAAAGGMMPPMDPAAAGAAGMPPMGDPMMGGGMGMMPMDPMAQGGQGQQKMKPEQMMQILDFRLYNMQQQVTALLNALNVEIPPGALVMPPGQMSPQPEAAMPGGPMDPAQSAMGGGGGGGGGSAISPIEPMPGASPEMAQMGGGGGGGGAPKTAAARWNPATAVQNLPDDVEEFKKEAEANAPAGWRVLMVKANEHDGDVDEEDAPKKSSPPQKSLNVPGAPGKRPGTQAITAGGSKDPKSRTESGDSLGPANKAAAFGVAAALFDQDEGPNVGHGVDRDLVSTHQDSPVQGAAALAAMFRSKTQHGD